MSTSTKDPEQKSTAGESSPSHSPRAALAENAAMQDVRAFLHHIDQLITSAASLAVWAAGLQSDARHAGMGEDLLSYLETHAESMRRVIALLEAAQRELQRYS